MTTLMEQAVGKCPVSEWAHCYDDSWQGHIVDEAFAHPAKFAYGLINRIVKHMLERGWIRKGETVADPFGGIGTGGIVCAANGLQWLGVELEPRFVELAKANFQLNPWCRNGVCEIIQGDSRTFASLIGQCSAICTSPPFADNNQSIGAVGDTPGRRQQIHDSMPVEASYGSSPGQLASLPVGDLSAIISSPPYAESVKGDHGERESAEDSRNARRTEGGSLGQSQRSGGYGSSPGNLGNLKEGTIDACLTSPPYAANEKSDYRVKDENGLDRDERRGYQQGKGSFRGSETYGSTEGQIGALPAGELSAIVTSPPYEGTQVVTGQFDTKEWVEAGSPKCDLIHFRKDKSNGYNRANDDNLGNASGPTYWTAVKAIYEQCLLALKPGGVICVVVGNYVKAGKLVDLCGQTWTLLQHVGFDPVERIKALKTTTTEDAGLFESIKKTKSRVSFFRRLAIKKGSPDPGGEEVLFLRKPWEIGV